MSLSITEIFLQCHSSRGERRRIDHFTRMIYGIDEYDQNMIQSMDATNSPSRFFINSPSRSLILTDDRREIGIHSSLSNSLVFFFLFTVLASLLIFGVLTTSEKGDAVRPGDNISK